ncbi:hypothetical protein phiA047_0105 [Aeromonas phage phiA047]|nr:hypothetical protein phiA047_0105 [Aeromonas phage phiA047]
MAYTMFISGLMGGKESIDNRRKLRTVADNEVVMVFDVVDTYNISLSNEKTQYPVESRSEVTDHVFSPDGKFNFTAKITTAPYLIRNRVEWDVYTDEDSPKIAERIPKAYEVLKEARRERLPVTLEFEEGTLQNYVITNVEMSREGSWDMMTFNISLAEMRTVTVGKTVLAMNVGDSLKNTAKTNTNKGAKQGDVPALLDRKNVQVTTGRNVLNKNEAEFLEKKLTTVVPAGQVPNKL